MGAGVKYTRIPWKYKVAEPFAYKLQCQYTIKEDYHCPYFSITTDGWLIIYDLYAWDGATWFPDFDWIKTQSAIHDALHECIRLGIIPESENDLIDKELELAIMGNPATRRTKQAVLKLRGWYIGKATNTVNEKAGSKPKVYDLPRLKHETTLDQYHWITGR